MRVLALLCCLFPLACGGPDVPEATEPKTPVEEACRALIERACERCAGYYALDQGFCEEIVENNLGGCRAIKEGPAWDACQDRVENLACPDASIPRSCQRAAGRR